MTAMMLLFLLLRACLRLQKPGTFLGDLHLLVRPGGVAVIISPYSWQAEYTDPSVSTSTRPWERQQRLR